MFLQVKTTPVGSDAVKFYLTDDENQPIFVGKPMIYPKAAAFIGLVVAITLSKKGTYTMDYGQVKIQKDTYASTIIVSDPDVYKWYIDKSVPNEVYKMVKNDHYTALSLKKASMKLHEFKNTPLIKLL